MKAWTRFSKGWQQRGTKTCAMCREELPLELFAIITNRHGKLTYHSYCSDCKGVRDRGYSKNYRRQLADGYKPAVKKAASAYQKRYRSENAERVQKYQKEYRQKNQSELSSKRQQKYHDLKKAQELEILETDHCDICGECGADWWWRSLSAGYGNHIVLHYECRADAVADGWLHEGARLRHKTLLKGENDG